MVNCLPDAMLPVHLCESTNVSPGRIHEFGEYRGNILFCHEFILLFFVLIRCNLQLP